MSSVNTTGTPRGKQQDGFSVIELLLVVVIILIIASISIPSLLHARMRANEAAAMASVRSINTAESMYAIAYPTVGYASSLANLGSHGSNCETATSTNACLLEDSLASGMKSGYLFEVIGDGNTPAQDYTVTASPESTITSGHCSFSSDRSGNILAHNATPDATPGGRSSSAAGSGGGCTL